MTNIAIYYHLRRLMSVLGSYGFLDNSCIKPMGFTGVHCTIGLQIRIAFDSYIVLSATFLKLVFNYPVHLVCAHVSVSYLLCHSSVYKHLNNF